MSEMILQTEGLTKTFGSIKAVDGLTLSVCRGEIFGLLGPNGAGKTTTIQMLCGLLKPDCGRVLLEGRPIQDGDAETRGLVGVCPQKIVLWGTLTCMEQLIFIGEMYGLSRKAAKQRGEQLLDALDLTEKRDRLASTLSGGMQRRLNLALALVHDPEILVLDEPEAGLDPQSKVLVREFIRSLARKKTVILTTHNMDEAERIADRVAIIDHGQLLVLDTPDALKHGTGEDDVLEIGLKGDPSSEDVSAALTGLSKAARWEYRDRSLTLRTSNAVALLPELLQAMLACGMPLGEVHMREKTLEDVFIQLTGRSLRE